jgi:trehalose/maltose hydrolase-like predicted phosphorylase
MTQTENPWKLIYDTYDPAQEGLREALCTLGNGYFASRGAAPESKAGDIHYPATYLAGGYNRLETEISGQIIENEDLVNFPNWLYLNFRIENGEWFDLGKVEILSYRQELDIYEGVLKRALRFQDKEGRISQVVCQRFIHQRLVHLGCQKLSIIAENWSGVIEFQSALDGRVINSGVKRYRELNSQHLVPLANSCHGDDIICLKVRTSQSEINMAQAMRTRISKDGQFLEADLSVVDEPGFIAHEFSTRLEQGQELGVEKIMALFTSRDKAISECQFSASVRVSKAENFDELLQSHILSWKHIWERFNIHVEGNGPRTLMVLHLHLFHLLQTVSEHTMDLDVGVPARGWHGEAYRGHIFWDELFILPLLTLRFPEITRALLRYRYRRLDRARLLAQDEGFQGAMYPWQSGSSGREESQKIHLNPKSGRWIPDNSALQRHVNLAIAFNVWHYYQVTRDVEFLNFAGAEMILEIARFFSSLTTYNSELDRYEINGVMGPDEYHEDYPGSHGKGLNNNAYTNVMTVWLMCRAIETLDILPEDRCRILCDNLGLKEDEIRRWKDISRKMRLVFHGKDKVIISQFEGYDKLKEFDWKKYREKYGDIMRLDRILEAEGDSPNFYKLSKQADLLMLFYLFSDTELKQLFERLGYPFNREMVEKNIDYYLYRTSHGSTLSQVVHSWVLSRKDRHRSWQLFTEALESDVRDVQGGTTPEGVHLGAMAGTVDLIQRCYLGVDARQDILWFDPILPREVAKLRLRLLYRGQLLEVTATQERLVVTALRNHKANAVKIGFSGEVFELRGKKTLEFNLP